MVPGPDGVNWNYSHSISFTYGPYRHTGFRSSVGAQLAITPSKTFRFSINYLGGPEQNSTVLGADGTTVEVNPNADTNVRNHVNLIALWTGSRCSRYVNLQLEAAFGHGQNAVGGTADGKDYAVVGAVRLRPHSIFAINLRGIASCILNGS